MRGIEKQACLRLLISMTVMIFLLLSSCSYAAAPSARQSGQIATVEHMLQETQDSIWQQLHSQEVDDFAQQLRAAEKAGRDDEAGRLRLRLAQIEKHLLGNTPPPDSELSWLLKKKQMLLDELARLGGGTQKAVFSAVAAAALPTGTSSISGTVTDSAGPVAGASVVVVGSNNYEIVKTDADGVYAVANISAGTYYVAFSADGHAVEWHENAPQQACATPVTLAVDKSETVDAVLEKIAVVETGSIAGTVKDGSNGDALLANVPVYAYLCGNASCDSFSSAGSGYTALDGTYTISGLPSGSYKVKFEAPYYSGPFGGSDSGLLDEWYNDKADSSSADVVAVTAPNAKTGIDATLAKGGSITGTVKDGSNGDALLANVSVYAYLCGNASCDSSSYAGSGYTALDGTYTISGLPSGSYKVKFYAPYGSGLFGEWYNDKADSNSADVVAVTAPNATPGINATLAKGGSITGTVKDGSNGDALLANVPVYAYLCGNASCDSFSSAGSGYTALDGTYTISGLPSGSYKVKFEAPYYSGPFGGSDSGLLDEWYNDKADSSSADVVAVTAPNAKTGIDATLAKGGSITGKVTDSAVTPAVVSGARVYAYESIVSSTGTYVHVTAYSSASTDGNGTYTISGLPSGSYKVKFEAPYYSGLLDEWYNDKADSNSADAVAVTAPNATLEIDATLAKGGSITGTVTNDGAAFKCANVYVDGAGSAVTDYQGKYTVKDLSSGSYKVYVSGKTSTGDSLWQWYDGRAEYRCADKVGVTAPDATTVDVAFPVQLQQCIGGGSLPAINVLLN